MYLISFVNEYFWLNGNNSTKSHQKPFTLCSCCSDHSQLDSLTYHFWGLDHHQAFTEVHFCPLHVPTAWLTCALDRQPKGPLRPPEVLRYICFSRIHPPTWRFSGVTLTRPPLQCQSQASLKPSHLVSPWQPTLYWAVITLMPVCGRTGCQSALKSLKLRILI